MFEPQCVETQAENRKREREQPLDCGRHIVIQTIAGLNKYVPKDKAECSMITADLQWAVSMFDNAQKHMDNLSQQLLECGFTKEQVQKIREGTK